MHQVGLVENGAIQLAVLRVLHEDLRSLRKAGKQLVRRLRGKDHRFLAAWPVGANRVVIAVKIMKCRMRQPGLIEMEGIDVAVEHFLDFLDVVQNAVIGALGDRQHPRLGAHAAGKRMRGDFFLDVFPAEFFLGDRPDDTEMIARRHQKDGNGASHDDRMEDRLVAVAVDDDDIARRHGRVPDNLVRRRRAVGDEEQVIGAEDTRRVAFGSRYRAGVVEQLSQFLDGIADIRAQHVLAEKLVEHLPDRRLEESDAARMSRTVPGVRAVGRIVRQGMKERRRHALQVCARFADDVTGDELGRVFEHVDEAVQLTQDIVGNVARRPRFPVQEDRNVLVTATNSEHESTQFVDGFLRLLAAELLVVDRQNESRSAALLLGERTQIAVTGHAQHFHAFGADRLGQRANAEPRGILRTEILVDDDDRKIEAHGVPLPKSNDPPRRVLANIEKMPAGYGP